ncbi:Pyridoxal-dependent decarboxylase family protein [Prochlorococcus marinus str. MIT 9515]|uniref:Pyridoxal-dependent decarboxylase family protein n=1 Tax=Prochlorococcus marinus (strain MIT 9515) TaxID=167542 RepID=A2BWP6_PROM5|nr:aminotransferase class V-fold PLP-dependent enzyme [Prochlorococcus marinus]ABM72207.1 Pyridoxal-dependent decarboxylase family protein [Prochlorococcus marinus str. MIT 9515]
MTVDSINKKEKLFPTYSGSNDSFIALLNKTSKVICNWFSNAEKLGPLPIDNNFKCSVPDETGKSTDVLFSEIESLIYSSFNPVHPGSLAHLDPPPLIISILGDLIAASLNNNLLAHELSPSISLLEESICKWFSKKIGFTESSGGIAASGGTLSNLNALVAARNQAGLASDHNAVFLISEDAHSSFIKCTLIMGLDKNNLIKVKTDNDGCMDIIDLKKIIDKCYREGKKIFSIVATLGTTIRGAIDPIEKISRICKERNIWLHIDGSIGGIFAITKIPINGISHVNFANSITINPQKILGIAKTSSILLVSDIEVLKNTFATGLPYISSEDNFLNRGELGIQGSRPAEIIKLWLGLRYLGMKGIEDVLSSSIEKRKFFEDNLSKEQYELCSGPLHIVSFLPKSMNKNESDAWTLDKRISLMKNNFMLSRPLIKNRYFLRAVLGNFNTDRTHIKELLKLLH